METSRLGFFSTTVRSCGRAAVLIMSLMGQRNPWRGRMVDTPSGILVQETVMETRSITVPLLGRFTVDHIPTVSDGCRPRSASSSSSPGKKGKNASPYPTASRLTSAQIVAIE